MQNNNRKHLKLGLFFALVYALVSASAEFAEERVRMAFLQLDEQQQ